MINTESIRHVAYLIWEKEGRPEGRADEHWKMAEEKVRESHETASQALGDTVAPTAKKASVPRKSSARSAATQDGEDGSALSSTSGESVPKTASSRKKAQPSQKA